MLTETEPTQHSNHVNFIYRLLIKSGTNYSINQVLETILATTEEETQKKIEQSLESLNFIIQKPKINTSKITRENLHNIAIGKNGDLAIIEDVNEREIKAFLLNSQKIETKSLLEFNKWFSGQVIQIEKIMETDREVKNRLKSLSPLKTIGFITFCWIAVAAFLSNILGLATSIFVMVVYDKVLPNQAVDSLYALAIGVALAVIFDAILKSARARLVTRSAIKSEISVTHDLFEQFVETANTKNRKPIGELASIIKDFEVYREFMSTATILTIIDLPFMFIFIFVIFLIGGPLYIIPLLCIPIIFISISMLQPILSKISKRVSISTQSRQGLLVEILTGLDSLRATGAYAIMKRKFSLESNVHSKATNIAKRYSELNGNIIAIVQQISQVAIIIFGFHLYKDQVITMGAIIGTVILSGRAIAPLAKMGQTLGRANAALTARKNLIEFLSSTRPKKNVTTKMFDLQSDQAIQINNVTLRLSETDLPLFNNLNLKISKGEKVGIVGRTGSGKTTLLKLIIGLLSHETGNITINGGDIRQFTRADLFRTIGNVFQDPWLFSGSLRDNISLGQDDCTDQIIQKCLNNVGITLSDDTTNRGLDFVIEDGGSNLSGGQKQAIMLARAMAFNPSIYVLDEPTSAMDAQMEQLIIKSMSDLIKEKTLVITTHKASILQMCDRVIVIEKGKIIGDGSKEAYFKAIRESTNNG
jgi:ATP-binding cassette, subfamily C, bacterial LapB